MILSLQGDNIVKLSHILFAPDGASDLERRAHRVYLAVLLTVIGVGIGLLGLLLTACASDVLPNAALLRSYFAHPLLLTLNLLPPVLLAWLGYFLSGRCWCGVALSALLGAGLPIVNYYKFMLRGDPLLASDLLLVRTAGGIVSRYELTLTTPVLAALFSLAAALLVSIFLMKRAALRRRTRLIGSLACLALAAALYFGAYTNEAVYRKTANNDLINIWSANEIYLSRGFSVSFLHSFPDMLPEKPEGYDAASAAAFLAAFPDADLPAGEEITVMGVMLEAFCDLTDFPALAALDTVQEVYAPWHALEEQSISGNLLTNIFAGGTVDTEWGFLTGESRHDDYRRAVDSYVRYFTAQGYAAHYAHPGYDWFYNRKNVNKYLGFDTSVFTENGFGELVDPVTATWSSDHELVDFLLADLDAMAGAPLFSFAVSYQNHGPYDAERSSIDYVGASELALSTESTHILNNYLIGVRRTIEAYVRLTEELDARDTPVVLVLFGDHKPWLGNGNSVYTELGIDLDTSTLSGFYHYYSTPYLIWANQAARATLGHDLTGDGGDFSPCYLMARLFDACAWEGPGFLQLQRELRAVTPLLHTDGFFLRDGVLTGLLPDADLALYQSYLCAQYYREHALY